METNAIFGFNRVQPIVSGQLPSDVHNLVARHVLNQESLLQAALNKDTEAVFHAFVSDPQVNHLPPEKAKQLFIRMLENTQEYLPGWAVEF
ncbi:hypothetical protein PUR_17120 [Paenibacillus sp. URB8-2]|nr:hypothetical protein PUR_17120 [Paenibacillus sp. URB8-2]